MTPRSDILHRSTLTRAQYFAEYARRTDAERIRRGDPAWKPMTVISLGLDLGLAPLEQPQQLGQHFTDLGRPILAYDISMTRAEAEAAHAEFLRAGARAPPTSFWSRLRHAIAAFLREIRA